MDNITLPSWSGLGLAYDIAVSADPSDPLTPLYARVRRQREEELLISVLVDWEYIEDAFDAPEICRWVDECAELETSEPAPPAWLLAQWAEEDRARHSVRERDHWGDPFPTLGEPTEDELLPALPPTPVEHGKKGKKRVILPDYGGAFPATEAYVGQKGYWPDSMEDTAYKGGSRERNAKSSGMLAALESLQAFAPDGLLEWGKLPLPELKGQPLYSKTTLTLAQQAVAPYLRSVGETACAWKLERGRNGGFHIELVVPAGSSSGLKGVQLVTDVRKLAKYLSKPADAWACLPNVKAKQIWTPEQLERGKVAACEEYLTRDRGPSGKERFRFWGSIGLGRGRR